MSLVKCRSRVQKIVAGIGKCFHFSLFNCLVFKTIYDPGIFLWKLNIFKLFFLKALKQPTFCFCFLFCFVFCFFLFFKTSFWENFYRIQSRYVNGNVNENLAETCDRGPWHMVKNRGDGQHTTRALSCTVKTRH